MRAIFVFSSRGQIMYNVVFKNIGDEIYRDVITWSTFGSKRGFDNWYDETMKKRYGVVAEGVTPARAIEICSTPEATQAVKDSRQRRRTGLTLRVLSGGN